MNERIAAWSILCAFALAACGGEASIEAGDAAALRQSVGALASDMTSAERARFGRDVIAVYEAAEGAELSYRDVYSDEHDALFATGDGDGDPDRDLFQGIALAAGEALDGKTVGALARDAEGLRRRYFAEHAAALRTRAEALEEARAASAKARAAYQAAADAAQARADALSTDRNAMIAGTSIDRLNYEGGAVLVKGKADIVNTLGEPIRRVDAALTARLPNVEGRRLSVGRVTVELDPPLAPGARRRVTFERRDEAGLDVLIPERGADRVTRTSPATLFGQGNVTDRPRMTPYRYVLAGGARGTFEIDEDARADIDALPARTQRCDQTAARVAAASAALKDAIAKAEALAAAPREVEPPSPAPVTDLSC